MSKAPTQEAAGLPEALSNSLSQLLRAPSTTGLLDLPTPIIEGILDILLPQNRYAQGGLHKTIKRDRILSLRLTCSMLNNLVLARTTRMAFRGTYKKTRGLSFLPVRLLQTFPNLQVLDLKQCQKSPLNLVGLPTTITALRLGATDTEKSKPRLDLSPLSKCIGLRNLDISSMKRVADLSPLAACQCLERLNIRLCVALTSLSALAHCTNLRTLDLSGTKITDLHPLSSCKELVSIACYKSGVSNLSPLSACEKLVNVDCTQTKVSDISPLSACLKLGEVYCQETSVRDISSLAACPQLWAIQCHRDVIGLQFGLQPRLDYLWAYHHDEDESDKGPEYRWSHPDFPIIVDFEVTLPVYVFPHSKDDWF